MVQLAIVNEELANTLVICTVIVIAKMLLTNFSNVYPVLGEGFIECHHDIHISIGIIRKTTLKHLSLVCSNCHRMLHRKHNGVYLTVSELREKFFK